jgi:hypothetical protein
MKRLWALLALCLPALAMAGLEQERQALLAGTWPQEEGLGVELAEWVEDGASIPIDLRLSGAQPPLTVSLLRDAEDEPRIARLTLWQWREPLRLGLRLRLPRSQAVEVLARDGSGRSWHLRRGVRVLGSSCLTAPVGDPRAGLGQGRLWLREQEGGLELASLLRHPMETGRRRDAAGQLLPRHLLQGLRIEEDGRALVDAELFEGSAANPYLRLLLPPGSQPRLEWREADGNRYRP